MKQKSAAIAKQIEELKVKLADQKRRELEALETEMLRLIRKADCHAAVIGFAKRQIDQQRTEN